MQVGKRAKILITVGVSVGLITWAMATKFIPRIVYNPSASAPIGLYLASPKAMPKVGDYVLLELPITVKIMALQRHYVGQNIPLLKQVFASSGDHICNKFDVIYVNYEAVTEVRTHDPSGREMPVWEGCRKLEKNEFFLLNLHSIYSFDSRYFGPVKQDKIIGVASPIWGQNNYQ